MAWAIAESVAAEERVRADARHDDAQVLYGIVDSLRHAAAQGPSTDAHSGHAAAGSSNDRSDSIEADPNDSQRVAGGGISPALRGRELARSILEAHLASGAGL